MEEKIRGLSMVAANGPEIENLGQKVIRFKAINQAFCGAAEAMSTSSPSGLRPISVNGGEEVVAVGDKEHSQEAALEPGSLPQEDEEAIEASDRGKRGETWSNQDG